MSTGTEDGTQEHPYNTIQGAIDAAIPPANIHIAEGLYPENLVMKEGIYLIGDGRDSVIVDGGGLGRAVEMIDVNYAGLRSLTIRNGSAEHGGGIYIKGVPSVETEIVLEDLVVKGNAATEYGGAIYVLQASLQLSRCVVDGNTASHGGGIYVLQTSPQIRSCVVTNNTANHGGGAIYAEESSGLISRCRLEENKASSGDGLFLNGKTPTGVNTVVAANDGQGIYLGFGSPLLTNCTVIKNRYYGIHPHSAFPTITNCILWENGDDLYQCRATYSCIQDGDPGEGNIADYPYLVLGNCHLKNLVPLHRCRRSRI